jgi:hypothetical protein
MWHSIASVRSMERSWGFGVRPPKPVVDLLVSGYKNGSTLPNFQADKLEYNL